MQIKATLLCGIDGGLLAVLCDVSRGATVVAGNVAILLVDATHAGHGHPCPGCLHRAHGGGVHLRVEASEGCHLLEAIVSHRGGHRCRLPAQHMLRVCVAVGVCVPVPVPMCVRMCVQERPGWVGGGGWARWEEGQLLPAGAAALWRPLAEVAATAQR